MLRPRTHEVYAYLLRVHILPALGHQPLSRINLVIVSAWNTDLRNGTLSDASAAKAYRLLRQICQSAVDDRLMRESPCRIKGAAVDRSREMVNGREASPSHHPPRHDQRAETGIEVSRSPSARL